mgnify:CR=1 FL=1|nr:acyltransferase [uncultured Fusobacterium sp.]
MEKVFKKRHYLELDYLKGIGIILVILGHSFSFTGFDLIKEEKYFIYYYIFNFIYSFHMPLFFIVAGFLSNKEYEIKYFYISKIKRLLIPYIFINIIDSIPRHLFSSFVNNSSNSLIRVIFYSGVATWFVYTLFVMFLLFPMLDKYIFKKDKYYIFLYFLLIINMLNPEMSNVNIFTLNRIIFYLTYFYFGYILKNYYEEIKKNKYFNNNLLYIILSIFSLFFLYKYSENNITKVIYPFIGFMLCLKFSLFLKKYRNIKFLEFCGKNSLIFYLLEPFFAAIYRVGLIKFIDLEYHYIIVILFFSLKLISVCISVIIINKIKILSFLFGNKIKVNKKEGK